MIKNKKTAFGLYVITFIVLWNILEILWQKFVEGIAYNIAIGFDIAVPLIIALITGYLFFLCDRTDINSKIEKVRGESGAVIIDVRNSDEYMQGHIPGAIIIPVDSIEAVQSTIPDKDTPIFTYCLRGSRSNRASKTLKAMGYSKVISMGGINKYKGKIEY